MAGYTLNKPHPGHVPTVSRVGSGRTETGGMRYATTLTCSCGWSPFRLSNVISTDSPSNGGRSVASHAYRRHVQAELVVAEAGEL